MDSAFDVIALSMGVITCLIGTLAFCLSSRLLQKLFAIDVAGTGVIALFVLIAARTGVATPVLVKPRRLVAPSPIRSRRP